MKKFFIKFIICLLSFSFLLNVSYIYKAYNRKKEIIIITCTCINNISEYLSRIENDLIKNDFNDLNYNRECIRYECLILDNSLYELSTLYYPIYTPTFTNDFSLFYTNGLTYTIENQNFENLSLYENIFNNSLKNFTDIRQNSKTLPIYTLITYYNITLHNLSNLY